MDPRAFQADAIDIVSVRQVAGIDQARTGQIRLRA